MKHVNHFLERILLRLVRKNRALIRRRMQEHIKQEENTQYSPNTGSQCGAGSSEDKGMT